tara:strand:- start:431 stop:652 length:222 start_codon:yes stop_codon:yes gene_type:complete
MVDERIEVLCTQRTVIRNAPMKATRQKKAAAALQQFVRDIKAMKDEPESKLLSCIRLLNTKQTRTLNREVGVI